MRQGSGRPGTNSILTIVARHSRERNSMTKPPQAATHAGMSAARDDVVRLFGHLEDDAITEILEMLPTVAELAEAQAWVVGQGDVLERAGHKQTPRIAAILDIVVDEDEEDRRKQ